MAKELDCGMNRNDKEDNSDLNDETERLVMRAHNPPKKLFFQLFIFNIGLLEIPKRNQSGSDPRAAETSCSGVIERGSETDEAVVTAPGETVVVVVEAVGKIVGRIGNLRGGRDIVRCVTTETEKMICVHIN